MWPLLVGIQMVKLTLFAIFLPSIIGSVGKIVSKGMKVFIFLIIFDYIYHFVGLTQVSGFSTNGQQHVDDLEFRDNYENSDVTNVNENGYTYPASGILSFQKLKNRCI